MRTYFITGASRGIGRATALALAEPGATLALAGRTTAALEELALEVQELGAQALVVPVDLRDLEGLEAAAQSALEVLGGLDVLINNGGIFNVRSLEHTDPAFFEDMLRVNLTAPLALTRTCLGALRASSSAVVVNVLSIAAETGFPANSAYSASKYGLRGLSDVWRAELGELEIQVRAVYPQGTDTSIFDDVPGDWDRSSMDSVEDVAKLIVRATMPDAPDELRMY